VRETATRLKIGKISLYEALKISVIQSDRKTYNLA
jgi:hypothetical protein